VSLRVSHISGVGLRQTTPAKEILSNMDNTIKPDKRNKEQELSPDKRIYLNLFFPEKLVEVFIHNNTFFLLRRDGDK